MCSATSMQASGSLQTSAGVLDFTGSTVTIDARHKIDVDAAEDGCLARLSVTLRLQGGCELNLIFDDKTAGVGGLVSATLMADSFCPGFPDATEGLYASDTRGYHPTWFTGPAEVGQAQATEACLSATVGFANTGLTLYRSLPTPAQLSVNFSGLSLSGAMLSRGYPEEGCVLQYLCTNGYTDGGNGFCLPTGTCAAGYHDDGTGNCAAEGCAAGYHDGGDGKCVAVGTCSPGYHDDGVGTCVATGCATGYHAGPDAVCVSDLTYCTDGATSRLIRQPAPGQLFITEVMPDPKTVTNANGEWFEIHATAAVDLNYLSFAPTLLSGGTTVQPTDFSCVALAAGQRAVLARTTATATNGGIAAIHAFGFGLPNAGGTVVIKAADGTQIDGAAYPAASSGVAKQLDEPAAASANDVETGFCDAPAPFAPNGELGSPSAANPARNACACVDPATSQLRFTVDPVVSQLVVSEVMANPALVGDAAGEWFEIYNSGTTGFDLNALDVENANGAASRTPLIAVSQQCVTVPAAGYRLAARGATSGTNGGLPTVDVTFSTTLLNADQGKVRILNGNALIDEATYPTPSSGASSQLARTKLDSVSNNTSTNFCAATAPWATGTDLGTPRAANDCP